MIENDKIIKYWDSLDFFLNKALWSHNGYEKSIKIRVNNLKKVSSIFNEEGITFFLEGRTLENIVLYNKLLVKDHDDDIGILKKDITLLKENVIPKLLQLGFKIIRDNSDMISLIRNDRYIDICFFEKKDKNNFGYGEKRFDQKYYLSLDRIKFEEEYFNIPNDCKKYLKLRYRNNKIIVRNILKIIRWSSKVPYKVFRRIKNLLFSREMYLSKSEFENLYVEQKNATNWRLRKPHMDLVTNGGEHVKIKDIINYFKEENNFRNTLNKVVETKMDHVFSDPIHLDRSFFFFWNNYFIYCIKY